jgi:hypothetical protein
MTVDPVMHACTWLFDSCHGFDVTMKIMFYPGLKPFFSVTFTMTFLFIPFQRRVGSFRMTLGGTSWGLYPYRMPSTLVFHLETKKI